LKRININESLSLSRIIHGYWRASDWNMTIKEMSHFIQSTIELGVTSFDHADIYGDYTCEALFGNAFQFTSIPRDNIQIITKCGIKLKSEKYAGRTIKTYDYSKNYIINSAEQSIRNLKSSYIDVLLLHRPSPFFDPAEVAEAFSILKDQGLVRAFGVSNFLPHHFELLQTYVDEPLVTNQLEISPYCLEHFENGNLDFLLKNKIKPMSWSPLAGGQLFNPNDARTIRLHEVVSEVADELGVGAIEQIVYAWLLKHPTQIMPVIGTGKYDRLKLACKSLSIDLSMEQWYRIYIASTGQELP